MLKVGLTGNIGSGKSMVSGIFATLGIPVYHADEESKKIMSDLPVKEEIVRLFGYSILTNDGEINHRSLATIVFTEPAALARLNSILHPRVMSGFRNWADGQQTAPYVVMEAAILFESGISGEFDHIIHISCSKEIAIDRVMKRDRVDGNSVMRRMQFQMEDEEKSLLAQFVVRNNGNELVIPQVMAIHRQLLEPYPHRYGNEAPGVI